MEEWRQISDFPNYSVSSFGNVINVKTNKMLRLCNKGGYYNVSLTKAEEYLRVLSIEQVQEIIKQMNKGGSSNINNYPEDIIS
jgi:hypothetical protein